jgi:hypothetical protein
VRVAFILAALLMGLIALPAAAAAATCELTTAVSPGHEITITGTGFAPSASVAITTTWSGSNATAGGNTGPQTTTDTATTDASGEFTFTIDAGPGRGGTYDVEATAGGCTATARVEALETAGGLNNGGAGVTPPPTDTVAVPSGRSGSGLPVADLLAIVLAAAVVGLVLVLRRARAVGEER